MFGSAAPAAVRACSQAGGSFSTRDAPTPASALIKAPGYWNRTPADSRTAHIRGQHAQPKQCRRHPGASCAFQKTFWLLGTIPAKHHDASLAVANRIQSQKMYAGAIIASVMTPELPCLGNNQRILLHSGFAQSCPRWIIQSSNCLSSAISHQCRDSAPESRPPGTPCWVMPIAKDSCVLVGPGRH